MHVGARRGRPAAPGTMREDGVRVHACAALGTIHWCSAPKLTRTEILASGFVIGQGGWRARAARVRVRVRIGVGVEVRVRAWVAARTSPMSSVIGVSTGWRKSEGG